MDPFVYIQFVLLVIVVCVPDNTSSMSKEEKNQLREKVLEMFNHGYRSYMDYAYPADELMPLSCKGRYRGVQHSRGDVDDILGNYTLTLIDTLDTLVVLGEIDEFERAARLIIQGVKFDNDIVVSVFEVNIRVLGGLLGGHVMARFLKSRKKGMDWYRDELLDKAKDIGNRLLPAFNTTTGMPYPRVNLRYGVKHEMSRTGSEKDTCTACAGTMILEMSALSRLSGDPIYEEKARKAMSYLWQSRHRTSDLVGTVINIHNGDWVRRDSGVGAGIDSYYEYLLKAYILLGDETYLDRFNKHYAAIRKYINQGPLLVDVHMHKPLTNSRNFMDALLAFWPGLQVLIGDMKPAIETHEMLYQVMQRHNFLPEAFTTDFRVHWAQHPLRPEFLESTYFLFKATGEDHYLEVGKEILENLEQHARVKCGYAAIKDVTTGTHEDQMDSYVLAETFKYLYLLFSEPEDLVLDIDNFIFTTEAHLLPLSLSTHNRTQNGTRMPEIDLGDMEDKNYERTCPNTNHVFEADYVKSFRDPLKNMVDISCPASQTSTDDFFTIYYVEVQLTWTHQSRSEQYSAMEQWRYLLTGRRSRLKASEFMAGNKAQLEELRRMGISVLTMKDGRVQLLHTATDAKSTEDAEDGMMFMQEMIELSKNQVSEAAQHEVCVLQYMTPPFVGVQSISAGPAQFGHDLKKQGEVKGHIILAEPFKACQALDNEKDIYGNIVIMERGDCMFVDKARQIQGSGALAGIVIDSHEGTTSSSQPLFAMSGDGRDDIIIPMMFLFHVEGQQLLKAHQEFPELIVYLNSSPKKSEDVLADLLKDSVQKARIEASSTTDPSSLQATADSTSEEVGTSHTEEILLGGVGIRIKTNRQNLQQDVSKDQTDKSSSSEKLVADVVAELTEHTNFQSLGKASNYLAAITKMMEAIAKGNYNIMDADALEHLEDLTQQLKPKMKVDSISNTDGDPDRQAGPSYKEAFTNEMNQAVDTFIIQELQRVVDEASGLVPKTDSPEQVGGDAFIPAESPDVELRSYASAEELEGGMLEGGVFEKSGQRYLPPNVEQAPDWMELDSGQVVIGNDGHVYADLKDSYWDWAREDGELPSSNEKDQSSSVISSSPHPKLADAPSTHTVPNGVDRDLKTGQGLDQASTSHSKVPPSSHLSDSSRLDASSSPADQESHADSSDHLGKTVKSERNTRTSDENKDEL